MRQGGSSLSLFWAVCLTVLCWLASANGQCLLGLDIDPSKSTFTAGGELIQPLQAPILVPANQTLSLAGRLFLSFPTGACPTTPQAFANALPGAMVVTPPDADPVRVQPASFQAQVGEAALAQVTFYGIDFNLSSSPLPPLPATPANGAYGTTLFSQVVNGSSSVSTSLPIAGADGGGSSVQMDSLTTNSSVLISVYSTGTSGVRLAFSNFNFTYVSQFETLGLQGEASYFFAGSVQGSAILGCPRGCGVHGSCRANGNQKACVCACGYGGDDCTQIIQANCPPSPTKTTSPKSAAPAPTPAKAAAVASPPAAPVTAPTQSGDTAAGQEAVPILSGGSSPSPPQQSTADALQESVSSGTTGGGALGLLAGNTFSASKDLDPKNNIAVCKNGATPACTSCQQGWQGANCDSCVSDQVCKASLGDAAATCNTSFAYTKHTLYKSYVCDFSQTVLSGLLAPQRGYWIDCNTTQVRNDAGHLGGYCRLGLRLLQYPDNPIQCTASACQFKEGSTQIQCETSQCACPQGACPDVAAAYIDQIQNKSITATCDQTTGVCNIAIQDFPIQLETPCQAGDCVSEKNPVLNSGTFTTTVHRDYSSVIAAIPIMALLALCIMAALVTLFAAAFRSVGPHGATPAVFAPAGKERMSRAPANPIHVLRFEHVSCIVPEWLRDDHLAREGGQRGRSPGHGRPIDNGVDKSIVTANGMENGTNGYGHGQNGVHQNGKGDAHMSLSGQVRVGATNDDSPVKGSSRRRGPQCRKPALCQRLCDKVLGRRSMKTILDNATGQAKMGELVGVLGPSGCGKTTLLSVLAGSVSSLSHNSKLYGHVTLDGQPRRSWASRLVAYVPQFDFLLPTLTVAETLRYSAQLRLPRTATAAEVKARVEGVLYELGLEHVAGSQVGGSSGIRGISGGERRRVTIGMELVIDPSILVLDEPTSGLDSYTAVNLMTTLKQVAQAGRIVMLSFHQPSPAMYELLDRVFLMARGHMVYSGEPDAAYGHFERAGLPCPGHTAIAEHMLTSVSDPVMLQTLMAHVEAKGPHAGIAAAEFAELPTSTGPGYEKDEPQGIARALTLHKKPARAPLARELAVLFWRTLTEILRNPTLLLMHCLMALIMGVLCGFIFFHISNDIAGAQNRLGAVFFSLVFLALTSLTTVDLLVNERGLVVKECLGGYYRPFSYYISKATLDGLLLRVVPAVLYSIPFYPMIGFQKDPAHVALFFCVLAVFSATVGALSMAVTVGFGTAGKAALIMNLVLLLSLLFTGYLVNIAAVTVWLRWVHYLSVFFYGFESLIVNEMSGINLLFAAQGVSVNITGDLFLQLISVNTSVLVRDVLILDAYFFFFVLCGVLLLYITLPKPMVVRRPRSIKGASFPSYTAESFQHSSSTSSLGNGVLAIEPPHAQQQQPTPRHAFSTY
ncbi:probable broad substrate specificity ATP-binding cassette transporter at C-terminar half [Coccomyxa sp. Obi]|nr:probable broad substrate specificity ATP-binding cassette transporter at C-terminar half [Coccomyxa sp. Obi]